jgi:hypothetical protein
VDNEELRVLIRTTADTRGATQTDTALKGVQQSASATDRSMRSLSERSSGRLFGGSTTEAIRFGTSLVGINLGLNLAAGAADNFRELITRSVQATAEASRVNRTLAASYGEASPEISRFADALARSARIPRTDVAEAAINARTLGQNYGFTTQQIETLIERTADLAVANGQGLPEAFQRIQSAMRGEAESAEALGLVLNANFLSERQRAAGVQQSFFTLTQAQQAQVIYTEFLRQSAQFAGTAASSTGDLDRALAGASTSMQNFQVELGKLAAPAAQQALQTQISLLDQLTASLKNLGQVQPPTPPQVAVQRPIERVPIGPAEDPQRAAQRRAEQDELDRLRRTFRTEALPPIPQVRPLTGPIFQRPGADIAAARELARQLAAVGDEVQKITQLRQNAPQNAGIAALGDLATVNQQIQANRSATQEIINQRRALEERARPGALGPLAAQFGPEVVSQAQEAAQRQLELLSQFEPIEQRRLAIEQQRQALQQQTLQLTVRQAAVELSLLPARQEIARIDREINSAAAQQNQLVRERAVLLAQQRAAPATQRLEDTQAQIERNRLLLRVRGATTPEERRDIRLEQRDLRRGLPGQELAAFDATRQLDLTRRDTGTAQLAEELRRNTLQQQQAAIRAGIQPGEERVIALQAQQEQLNLLGRVAEAASTTLKDQLDKLIEAAANPQPIALTIQLQDQAGNVNQVFDELLEASRQAQMPPIVIQSGVRRPG